MRYWRKGILLFQLLTLWSFLYGQVKTLPIEQPKYIFRHIDNTNGLLSNDVFSFAQDSKGYMWIGTAKGLQRYDGLRFVHFADTITGPVSGTLVATLQPDANGQRLLYNQYYTHLREWKFLQNKASLLLPAKEFNRSKANSYADPAKGNWLIQEYNTGKTSPDGKIKEGIALIQSPDSASPLFANFIKDDRLQKLWITGHAHGILLFDDRTKTHCGKTTNFDNNALLQLIDANPAILRSITMDSRGNVWMITWSNLIYRYHAQTNQLHSYSLTNINQRKGTSHTLLKWASSMLEDNHGKIWIGTAGAGLLTYDEEKDDFTYILHEPGNDLSIRYNYEVSSIFQDREENIWLGTDRGINIFNPYRQYFTSLGNPSPGGKSLPGSEITDVRPWQNGKLLVATWGSGTFICDQQLNIERSIFFKDNHDKNQAWCFVEDDDGNTWIGCQHGFLHVLNKAGIVLRTIQAPEFEHTTIRYMQKDSRGNILFGLHNGKIVTWDKQSNRFLPLAATKQPTSIPYSTVLSLLITGEECWAGTVSGLARFDLPERYFTGVYKPMAVAPGSCNSIAIYNDSLLLAGFENDGLYFFNKRTKTFKKIVVDYDQPLWSAHAISKDREGNIWFTTEYDVCKYEPLTNEFRAWHPETGLLYSSFFQFSRLAPLPSGDWLTWTHTEVVRFSLAAISKQEASSMPVTITGLKVFDKPVFIDSLLHYHRPLQLAYNENFLTIAYSNLLFSGVTNTAYYHRLRDVDKGWVAATEKGYAGYTNLAPGQYRFEVKTGESESPDNIASIDIEIMAPFWQTTWFRVLCVVLIAGLIYAIVSWRFRTMRSEAAMKEQIAKTEMMALRAQMNPHFIFNCINGIDALILSDDKYQATIYLNKFAMLIRNILDSSKQNTISLNKDLETLRLYIELEQWRHENKFTAEIKTGETVFDEDYKVPPLVVQPYVENAILHGLRHRTDNKGKLTIEIFKKNDSLVYIIEDNGVGRSAPRQDKQHRSYGMEINLGRLKLFNKQSATPVQVTDLTENGQATGTRVEISLKIQ
jgi:ligand-binding sensor domain-containing protein/two-component sensor histidine kinase